jgi:hypothetical protein
MPLNPMTLAAPTPTLSVPLTQDALLSWRQCQRHHWLDHCAPGAEASASSARPPMAEAHNVIDLPGTLAALKATWPQGRHLPEPRTEVQWQAALAQTQAWLSEGFLMGGVGGVGGEDRAIFGACLASNDGARARIDVLSPGERGLRIGRVRLATAGSDLDVDLVAWWTHIAARAGLRVQSMVMMLVEPDFIYPGHGCLAGVFREVDLSPIIGLRKVPDWLVGMRQTARGPEPALPLDPPCLHVAEHEVHCPHLAHCGLNQRAAKGLRVNALEVVGRELADVLRAEGHRRLDTVPEARLPDARRQRAWRAVTQSRVVIDDAASVIAALPRPWHLLRLDTIGHALPIWAGTRPYQMVPFHWSCLTLPDGLKGDSTHTHFLASGTGDPRRAFADSLLRTLGTQGALIAYNAGFERNRLRELARFAPDLAPALDALQPRIVDLFQLMRAHAYHPQMRGSWSFKSVCRAWVPDAPPAIIGRFNDTHATPAEAFAHAMQDRLPAAEVQAIHAALQAHGLAEVQALRALLQALVAPPE